MSDKVKKSMSKYMKVYLSVVAVFVALLVVACIVLWNLLDAYEKTRPRHVAEEIFNKYFVTFNVGGFVEELNADVESFESTESINQGVKEAYSGAELNFVSVSTDGEGNEKFVVTADNKRIAGFTVSKTDKTAGFGLKYAKVSSAEFFFAEYSDVNVRVPKGYTLMVNGKTVGDKYISKADIEGKSCQYMPEGVEGVKYNDYKISGLFFKPTLKVMAPNGTESVISFDNVEKIYIADVVNDEALEAEYTEHILKAARAYTLYLSNDGPFSEIAQYLDRKSPYYTRLSKVEVEWVRDHSSYKISNEKASEFYKYSDDVFSCRVTLDETLVRSGYKDYVEHIDVIFYLKKVDGKFKIYEIATNS